MVVVEDEPSMSLTISLVLAVVGKTPLLELT